MPAGSTWSRSKVACSAANASTVGLVLASAFNPKSAPGNDSETPHAPVSNGCSQSTKPAPKWVAPILAKPISGASSSKSHNYGAGVLGAIEERALLHHTLGDGNFGNMLSAHRDFS